MEYAFDSLWFVVSLDDSILWRLGGDPAGLKTHGSNSGTNTVLQLS